MFSPRHILLGRREEHYSALGGERNGGELVPHHLKKENQVFLNGPQRKETKIIGGGCIIYRLKGLRRCVPLESNKKKADASDLRPGKRKHTPGQEESFGGHGRGRLLSIKKKDGGFCGDRKKQELKIKKPPYFWRGISGTAKKEQLESWKGDAGSEEGGLRLIHLVGKARGRGEFDFTQRRPRERSLDIP